MSFKDFSFSSAVDNAITRCGFTEPTPIQQQAIPLILKGNDLLGLAQTGTGKTAAFILPVVQRLLAAQDQSAGKKPRVLILAPTRELAEQINSFASSVTEKTRLRSLAIYGGVPKGRQLQGLARGAQLLIACPGRLLDLIREKHIDLSSIEYLILDEADQMFDRGFLPEIRSILRQLPKQRQSLIFSATMPDEIRRLTDEVLHKPVTVQLSPTTSVQSIRHTVYQIAQADKIKFLVKKLRELAGGEQKTTLVFTRTKYKARNLASKLEKEGFAATSLQGNLSQNRRQEALEGFRSGRYRIMVATDIAARGIDIDDIGHVINFDAPDTVETYIHRTGRTGRAQRSGDAWTFATAEDEKIIKGIEKNLGTRLQKEVLEQSRPAEAPAEPRNTRPAPRPARKRQPRGRGAAPQGAHNKPVAGAKSASAESPETQQPTGKKNRRTSAKRKSSIFGLSSRPVAENSSDDQARKKIPRAAKQVKGGKAPANTNNTAGQKTAREKSRNTQRSSYNG